MSSQISSDLSDGRGSVPLRVALVVASLSWILLFLLGTYTELVGGTPEILFVNLLLLVSPFLVARWYSSRNAI
jgi:hypothetical protein